MKFGVSTEISTETAFWGVLGITVVLKMILCSSILFYLSNPDNRGLNAYIFSILSSMVTSVAASILIT